MSQLVSTFCPVWYTLRLLCCHAARMKDAGPVRGAGCRVAGRGIGVGQDRESRKVARGSRKFRRTGRHTAPSQARKVTRPAGQAAPAVAVVGALAAAPQTAFASTSAPAAAGHAGQATGAHQVTRAHLVSRDAATHAGRAGGADLHGPDRGHAERDRAAVLRPRQRLAVALPHQPRQDQRPEPDLHRAGVQRPG